MRRLLILGAGTAGTIMANRLAPVLDPGEWNITIVDQNETHYYQPGFLFIPFGLYSARDVEQPRRNFFPPGVDLIIDPIDRIEPKSNSVILKSGRTLPYDYLIIATGTQTCPEETEGMMDDLWYKEKFDFYTVEGAVALGRFFESWEGGRLVLNITEMPIKCPVAPLEFLFLADDYFTSRGMRDKVDLHFVTPLSGAFTRPRASAIFGGMLGRKNIRVTPDFNIARVDNAAKKIVSWDDIEIPYDVLVTIPTNKGNAAIGRSGLGDELDFVPTNKETLRSLAYENIFVIGDATNLPSSKAGSVAHFEAEILQENLIAAIEGREPAARFDGHSNCFIESGHGKGILIDFNYDIEPLPGRFPYAGIGPFSLLKETRVNHFGKVFFRWIYWHLLLKGRELPLDSAMSMAGKEI